MITLITMKDSIAPIIHRAIMGLDIMYLVVREEFKIELPLLNLLRANSYWEILNKRFST